ncbi:MAG TPA: hypothetical protein VMN57_02180 [Anaerolineales bacterium]|nr:hypothetical protein [Anaerolineales bacterium]
MKTRIILSIAGAVLALTAGMALLPPSAGYASSPATLTLGRTVVPEGDDFATKVLGQPWNMQSEPYPDYFTVIKNFDRPSFEVTGDGQWKLLSTNNDPVLYLHWPGIPTTQSVLRMGDTRPIDASRYKLLSYYMCLDTAPSSTNGLDEDWAAKVYWMYDRSNFEEPANGSTAYVFLKQQKLFENNGDCELMTIDLSKPSSWVHGSWNNDPNMITTFRIDPLNKGGKSMRIDWVRLTSIDTSNTVPLSWEGAPVGELKFYLSQQACGSDGILVGTSANPSGSGTFQWGAQLQPGYSAAYPLPIPESFEPGDYQVYLKDINGEIACSATPLTIHRAPILAFQGPSGYSGLDYASTVLNDPWGMSNSGDIKASVQIANMVFSNGILTGVTTDWDPRLTLKVGPPIDAAKYRYATFRMKVDGTGSAGTGWVQRFLWWFAGEGVDAVTTQDLVLYEGWHTYTIDLSKALIESCPTQIGPNCWSGFPTGFRFDPVETPGNTTFHLDFVTLTSIESVQQGQGLKVYYTLPNAPEAVVSMYLDSDTNPNNGRISAPQLSGQILNPQNGPFEIFIPLATRAGAPANTELNFFDGSLVYTIDTNGISPATYYISADIFDGVMTTTWYSDTPVIIE